MKVVLVTHFLFICLFISKLIFTGVELFYNVVSVSAAQQSEAAKIMLMNECKVYGAEPGT